MFFVSAPIALLLWYVIGTQYNLRLGRRALKWLQRGLPLLGEKATLRWQGTSLVELKIPKARDPFRSAEVIILLEPRDIPPLWWLARRRGGRDLLIFRSQLRSAPHFDLDARSQKIGIELTDHQNGSHNKWTPVQGGLANSMNADYRGALSPFSINRLIVQASMDGPTLTRLVVHRAVPNLEVHFLLPNFEQVSTRRMFESLRQLGEEVLKL